MKKGILLFFLFPFLLFLLFFIVLFGGSSASSRENTSALGVMLPIEVEGIFNGDSLTLNFSGGIVAEGVVGSRKEGNTFSFSTGSFYVDYGLPESDEARLDFFSYMPQLSDEFYQGVDKSSAQYKLNEQCNNVGGFRKLNQSYLVAMGSFYGKVGNALELGFADGKTISAVIGDIKADSETDSLNQFHESGDKSVVEFIMDSRKDSYNQLINEKFDTLSFIHGKGNRLEGEVELDGSTVKISGKVDEIPFFASGELSNGRFLAKGFYGEGVGIGQLQYPLPRVYPVSSPFGHRESSETNGVGTTEHSGVDIAVPEGVPVLAAEDGTALIAGWNGGYGKCVEISHKDGLITKYAHMSKIDVKKGESVHRGQKIGEVGNTGNSTGPHLHFEVLVNGKAVDPLPFVFGSSER